MTAVLLGINENRLAHFKAERASILLFLLHGWPIHIFRVLEELPPPPLWAAHSGCHYQAGVNGLQLMSSTTSTALSYCHWLSATEHWHQSTEGMAKKKNYKFVLERIRKGECGCCSLGSRGTGWLSVPSDSAAHMPEHLPLHAPSVQLQSKINK